MFNFNAQATECCCDLPFELAFPRKSRCLKEACVGLSDEFTSNGVRRGVFYISRRRTRNPASTSGKKLAEGGRWKMCGRGLGKYKGIHPLTPSVGKGDRRQKQAVEWVIQDQQM